MDTTPSKDALVCAGLWMLDQRAVQARAISTRRGDPTTPWSMTDCWRVNDVAHQDLQFRWDDNQSIVSALPQGGGHLFKLRDGNDEVSCQVLGSVDRSGRVQAVIDGRGVSARVVCVNNDLTVFIDHRTYGIQLADPALLAADDDADAPMLAAPMPGKVVSVNVTAGDEVTAGTTLIVLEAMKMEHAIKAPMDGRVTAVHYGVGDQVDEGIDLLAFEEADQDG